MFIPSFTNTYIQIYVSFILRLSSFENITFTEPWLILKSNNNLKQYRFVRLNWWVEQNTSTNIDICMYEFNKWGVSCKRHRHTEINTTPNMCKVSSPSINLIGRKVSTMLGNTILSFCGGMWWVRLCCTTNGTCLRRGTLPALVLFIEK